MAGLLHLFAMGFRLNQVGQSSVAEGFCWVRELYFNVSYLCSSDCPLSKEVFQFHEKGNQVHLNP